MSDTLSGVWLFATIFLAACAYQPPDHGVVCGDEVCPTGWSCGGEVCVPPAPGCGNGQLDPGEECDDGNPSDDDGCTGACERARCGDGTVRVPVEECDPGDDPSCPADCLRCDGGSVRPETGSCYRVEPGLDDWDTQADSCALAGGHLATITSQEEWNFLLSLSMPDSPPMFAGGSDSAMEGSWTWITGEPWVFEAWVPGEPNNFNGNQNILLLCPFATSEGCPGTGWDDTFRDPTSQALALCEREPWRLASGAQAYSVDHFARGGLAGDACNGRGGNLAVLSSELMSVVPELAFVGAAWLSPMAGGGCQALVVLPEGIAMPMPMPCTTKLPQICQAL